MLKANQQRHISRQHTEIEMVFVCKNAHAKIHTKEAGQNNLLCA